MFCYHLHLKKFPCSKPPPFTPLKTDAAPTQAISEAVTKYASNPYLKIAQPVDVDKVNAPVAAAPQQQPSHHTSKHESQQQPQPAAPQKQQSIKEDVHKSDSTTENNSLQQKQQQNTINRKKVVEQGHAVEITASTKNPSPLSDLAVSDSSVPQAASTTVTALSSTQEQQHTSVKTITDSGKATEVSTGDASGVKQVHAPSKHEEASETPAIAAASTSTAAPLHRNSIVKKTPDVQNQQPSSTLTRHPEHAPSYKLDASYPPSKDDYYKAMHQQPPPPQAVQQQQIQQQQKFPVLSTANNQDTRTLKKQPRQASSPPSVSIPPIVNKFTSAANTSTVINILQKSQNPIYVYSNNNNNNNNHHHADAKLPNLHQQQQDANGGATHNFSSYHSAQNALRLQIKDKMVAAASNNNASSSINDLNNGSNGDVSGGAARRRRKRHGSPGPVNAAANGGGAFMANIRKQAAEAAGFGVWSNDLGIIGKQAQVTISSKVR